MKKSLFFMVVLTFVFVVAMMPATVLAADSTSVTIDNVTLSDGSNEAGGGTATFDKANSTLTLENVKAVKGISVSGAGTVKVIVKGNCSVGTKAVPTDRVALWADVADLNVQILDGASLSLYSEDANAVYNAGGNLTVSGPGKLVAANTAEDVLYPALVAKSNVTLKAGLVADLSSDWNGVYSENGNITVESSDISIKAGGLGLFAETYDSSAIPSAVTLKDSKVEIDTSDNMMAGIFCGTGGIKVDNTVLKIKTDKTEDKNQEAYSMYTDGDITIQGAKTNITIDDALGVSAGEKLNIENGTIQVNSVDTALYGWNGVNITGGVIKATSEKNSAIVGRDGTVSITGENTSVTAVNKTETYATIRNIVAGGLSLDAPVSAENTAGGKPFEGVSTTGDGAITVGEKYDLFGAELFTKKVDKKNHTYFVPAGSDGSEAVTGKAVLCNHAWGNPSWKWSEENDNATATFTCAKDSTHIKELKAKVVSETVAATCGKDGQTVYTATVTFSGKEYSDQKTEVIPATGKHTYENGKCTVCGASDPNKPEINPGQKSDNAVTSSDNQKKDDNTATGDESNISLWVVLALAAAGGATGTVVYGRKRKVS